MIVVIPTLFGDTFWFEEDRQESVVSIVETGLLVDNKFFRLASLYKYYVEGDTLFINLQ